MNKPVDLRFLKNGGLSRRQLLMTLAGGAAGLTLPSREAIAAPRKLKGTSNGQVGDLLWDYPLPNSGFTQGNTIVNGSIISYLNAVGSSIQMACFDLQNPNPPVWIQQYPLNDTGVLEDFIGFGTANGNLYAFHQSGFLVVNPADGTQLSARSYPFRPYSMQTSALITENGFISVAGGSPTCNLVAFDLLGNLLWSSPISGAISPLFPRPVASSGVILVAGNILASLQAYDSTNGNPIWNRSIAVAGELAVGGGNVYVPSSSSGNSVLRALDAASGTDRWTWTAPQSSSSLNSPAIYNGSIFVNDEEGNLFVLDAMTGNLVWSVLSGQGDFLYPPGSPSGLNPCPIFLEDGLMYFGRLEGSKQVLNAMEIAQKGLDGVTYEIDEQANPYIVGLQNGACYFVHNETKNLAALNLNNQIHSFFAQSTLMVEDYTTGGSKGYMGSTTSFRTQIQLFDDNKNPRANKGVRVWASDATTIISGGKTYNIDNNGNKAELQTDGSGELTIITIANDITTPALYLWGSFMDQQEAIVIYPDQGTLETLSQVQGKDLQAATAYDGTPLLPSNYAAADHLANTITSAIGGTQSSLQATRNAHRLALQKRNVSIQDQNTYIAFPDSTPNMIYQQMAGPTDRTYTPTVQEWTAVFTGTDVTYSTGSSLSSARDLGRPAPRAALASLGFLDFLHNVVQGAERLAKIVVTAAKNFAIYVAGDVSHFYEFVADSVEKAAAVVKGTLLTVIGKIESAVQWLSYLFNWDDILLTKNAIKASISQAVTTFQQTLATLKSQNYKPVSDDLGSFDLSTQLTGAQQQLGSQTIQGQQQNQNNPQNVFGMGGANCYAQSSYLRSKVKDNTSQGTFVSGGDGPNDTNNLGQALYNLFNDLKTKITTDSDFQKLPDDARQIFANFSNLLSDPSDFVKQGFANLIQMFIDLIGGFVELFEQMLGEILNVIITAINWLLELVTAEINIPVVSPLYQMISGGSPLSILDLCSLLVAVPATIIYKAVSGQSTNQAVPHASAIQASNSPSLDQIAIAKPITIFYQASFLIANDLAGPDIGAIPGKIINGISIGLNIIPLVLGLTAAELNGSVPLSVAFAGLKFATPILGAIGWGAKFNPGNINPDTFKAFQTAAKSLVAWVTAVVNVAIFALAVTLAKLGKPGFGSFNSDKKSLYIVVVNMLSALPFIFRPLGTGESFSPPRIALAVIDGGSLYSVVGIDAALIAS